MAVERPFLALASSILPVVGNLLSGLSANKQAEYQQKILELTANSNLTAAELTLEAEKLKGEIDRERAKEELKKQQQLIIAAIAIVIILSVVTIIITKDK